MIHAIYATISLLVLALGFYLGHRFATMVTVKVLRRSLNEGGMQPVAQIHALTRVRNRLRDGESVTSVLSYIDSEQDRLEAIAKGITKDTVLQAVDDGVDDEEPPL